MAEEDNIMTGKVSKYGDVTIHKLCSRRSTRAYPSTYTVKQRGYETRAKPKKNFTCHPPGFRFIGEDDSPVSKSVQLMVPSEDAE